MSDPAICTCACCGYRWTRGLDGEHSCAANLHKLIAQMLPAVRWRCDSLSVDDQAELPALIEQAEMVAWRHLQPKPAGSSVWAEQQK